MKILKLFKSLTKFELCLWSVSIAAILISYIISGGDWLNLVGSLIGATSLILLARGFAFGNVLMIFFCIVYGIISIKFRYYGELITYACMTLPMSVISLITWLKNPYNKDSDEVKVSKLTKKKIIFIVFSAVAVTIAFYFILKFFNTANLIPSTVSVLTSYVAASLTAFRNPYFALGYASNDIVLIVLWSLASRTDVSYIPMVVCFITFFVNDMYGFFCWKRMEKRQKNNETRRK